jgi:hypothetical protein
MVIGTFNGWNIVAMPTTPGFSSLQVSYKVGTGVNTSPFTQQTQTLIWPGADIWTAHATLPPMNQQSFAPWLGFIHDCQGQANVFQLSLAQNPHPQTTGSSNKGKPIVTGTNPPMTNTLTTSGWPASTFRVLMPGDYIQLGYRLYMITDQANSDSSGNCTLQVTPSLRETPTAGESVILNSPKGLFRMAKPVVSYSINEVGVYGFEMDFQEAR